MAGVTRGGGLRRGCAGGAMMVGIASGEDGLTKEEETALFDFDVCVDPVPARIQSQSWIMAATVLSCRRFNVRAFIDTIIGVWKPFKGASGRSIADNLFVFEFQHERDMINVLQGGPWHFNNHLIITKRIESEEEAKLEELCWCRFWIQVLNLPSPRVSATQVKGIGEQLGRFVDYDHELMKGGYSHVTRLRIEIDVSKPIRRGLFVRFKGVQQWVDIRYEKLPNYCFWCGGFDHVERDCVAAFDDEAQEGDIRRFANLKAEPIRKTFMRTANDNRWDNKSNQWGPRFVHRREPSGSRGVLVQRCDEVLAQESDTEVQRGTKVLNIEPLLTKNMEVLTIKDGMAGQLDGTIGLDMTGGSMGLGGQLDRIMGLDRAKGNMDLDGQLGGNMVLDGQLKRNVGVDIGDRNVNKACGVLMKYKTGEAETGAEGKVIGSVADSELGRTVIGKGNYGGEPAKCGVGAAEGGSEETVGSSNGVAGIVEAEDNLDIGQVNKLLEKMGEVKGKESGSDLMVGLGDDLINKSNMDKEEVGETTSLSSVRKWKRKARVSQNNMRHEVISGPAKRGSSYDVEIEEGKDVKKLRQVDAVILASTTARPESQVRRSQ